MKRVVEIELNEIDEKAFSHKFTTELQQFTLESTLRGVVNGARDEFVRNARAAALESGTVLTLPDEVILATYVLPDADARKAAAEAKLAAERAEHEAAAKRGPLTSRQLRLGLVDNGFSLAQVEAAIEALPDGADKEKARIEWQYAGEFKRDHPLLMNIAAQLGISTEQFETMWTEAQKL